MKFCAKIERKYHFTERKKILRSLFIEIYHYINYFNKLQFGNKLNYIYKIIFPVLIIVFNSGNQYGDSLVASVIPWVSYLIFISGVSVVIETATLREQGYLKQYHTLVSHQSVFIISKFIVEIMFFCMSIVIIYTILCLLYPNDIISMLRLVHSSIVSGLVMTISIVFLMSFLLLLDLNLKSLNTLSGIIVMLALAFLYISTFNELGINLINPIFLTNYFMWAIYQNTQLGYQFFLPIFVYFGIGIYSFRCMHILPKEG